MILKNVTANWLFISKTDDENRYRLSFEVSPEQDEALHKAIDEVLKSKGLSGGEGCCDWYGSRKVLDNGKIQYAAKCHREITNKKGEIVVRDLPVYNRQAIRYDADKVPTPSNGALINVDVECYYVEYKKKKGVMLGLRSVQLLEFEEYAGANPYKNEDSAFEPVEVKASASEDDIFE